MQMLYNVQRLIEIYTVDAVQCTVSAGDQLAKVHRVQWCLPKIHNVDAVQCQAEIHAVDPVQCSVPAGDSYGRSCTVYVQYTERSNRRCSTVYSASRQSILLTLYILQCLVEIKNVNAAQCTVSDKTNLQTVYSVQRLLEIHTVDAVHCTVGGKDQLADTVRFLMEIKS
jgi:hypothetical protein